MAPVSIPICVFDDWASTHRWIKVTTQIAQKPYFWRSNAIVFAFVTGANGESGRWNQKPERGLTLRFKRKLVHVLFFKEGNRIPLDGLRKFVRSVAPDVNNDEITIMNAFINQWPEAPVNFALTSLAQTSPYYLWKESKESKGSYDMSTEELRCKDGSRVLILRVFAKERETVGLPTRAQKKSGWLGPLLGIIRGVEPPVVGQA